MTEERLAAASPPGPVALVLPNDAGAAYSARRLLCTELSAWHLDELSGDAVLAVSELVTNAVLHGRAPVELRLSRLPDGLRAEVYDGSRVIPVRPLHTTDAMTGRGIALVEAICARWGVEQLPDGKVVWCELVVGGQPLRDEDLDVDALLDAWDDEDEDAEPTYTVALGDVPTDLLIAAKAHVDNLVREFTLAAAGGAAGRTAVVPEELAQLIDTVVHRFAEARHALKRQAIAAANRGEARTDLTVTLSASAVEWGEEYLAALDTADSYARDSRLLTLETPPQHRVFRQWYVGALVDQIRRAAAGEPVTRPQTFEQRLLDELGTVAAAQRASARAARLQLVTARLASAATAEDVAEVVVSAGVSVLGASGGGLLLLKDGRIVVPGVVGYPTPLVRQLQSETPDADLPAAAAIRTGEAVWLESRQERDERFPALRTFEPQTIGVCAVPLQATGRVLGALRFSFDSPQLFDADERGFITALAAQTAQALERTELYEAERRARGQAEDVARRLARLQQVTAALSAAVDPRAIGEIVLKHAAEAAGASLTSFSLLVGDYTLAVVGSRGMAEATVGRWQTYPLSAQLPASEAVRTNEVVVVANRDELEERFPALAGQAVEDRSLICLPVSIGTRRLGVISLSFPTLHGFDDTELRFLRALADACAQALDRAGALERSRTATERLAFLAFASAELGRTLDFRETLSILTRLVVPRLADWASVEILEDGQLQTFALHHVDPDKIAFARQLRERYPVDPDGPAGVPAVVRTGVPELYTGITDEQLAAGAVDETHHELLRSLQMRSAVIVPLTGRAGTFGALTLIAVDPERTYDNAFLAFAEDVAARAAVAVENAKAYSQQSGRLAAITRVAEAAQHAILAPVPPRLGALRLCASYVSAARDALVGGDLYEAIERDGSVRLLIGDVRGKGLEAVRMATVVLGHFRSAAVECDDLASVARQVDERLRPYLGDEDFVTALIAEISPTGSCAIVTCGHPPALLAEAGVIRPVGAEDSLPLGLGADPHPVTVQLSPGSRLLLYTDGILEARDPDHGFVALADVVGPLADGTPLDDVLDAILDELRTHVGGALGDDLALVVAEFAD